MKIAFIGLGNMGGPMALNLHKAGHALSAFDLSAEACKKLARRGPGHRRSRRPTRSPGAEVVISMLPASQHVEGALPRQRRQAGPAGADRAPARW